MHQIVRRCIHHHTHNVRMSDQPFRKPACLRLAQRHLPRLIPKLRPVIRKVPIQLHALKSILAVQPIPIRVLALRQQRIHRPLPLPAIRFPHHPRIALLRHILRRQSTPCRRVLHAHPQNLSISIQIHRWILVEPSITIRINHPRRAHISPRLPLRSSHPIRVQLRHHKHIRMRQRARVLLLQHPPHLISHRHRPPMPRINSRHHHPPRPHHIRSADTVPLDRNFPTLGPCRRV